MKKALKILGLALLTPLGVLSFVVTGIGITQIYESIRASLLSQQEQWLEDIDRLDGVMKSEFAAYESLGKSQAFEDRLTTFRSAVEEGIVETNEQFALETIKAIAIFKDPHTVVYNQKALLERVFPFRVGWYDSAFYLTGTTGDARWLGSRVVSFNGTSGKEVFERLAVYTSAPNNDSHAYFLGSIQNAVAIYEDTGIVADGEQMQMEVVSAQGEQEVLSFGAMPRADFEASGDYTRLSSLFEGQEVTRWRRKPGVNYWYEPLPQEDVFYLRYAMCVAQGDIEAFWDDFFESLQKASPSRLIIDLRHNPGGDAQNHRTLVNRLVDHPLNQRGRLFVLIDRGTGSAAVGLTSDLDLQTEAIFVGEKTIDLANTTSDPTFFTLPHTGATLLVPALNSFNTHVHDRRDAITPDYRVPEQIGGASYVVDEALDFVLRQEFEPFSHAYAQLPTASAGDYTFSPIRYAHLDQDAQGLWHLRIDGLLERPIYEREDGRLMCAEDIWLTPEDSLGSAWSLHIHGATVPLWSLENPQMSLVDAIQNNDLQRFEACLAALREEGVMSDHLQRPFFQTWTYRLDRRDGFEAAYQFNQVVKEFYPHDPVVSIVDYELLEHNASGLAKFSALFPIAPKLFARYYEVVTTDKIMNDQYNAFISKE